MQTRKYAPRERKLLAVMAAVFVALGISTLIRDGEITGAFWVFAVAANLAGLLAAFGKKGDRTVLPAIIHDPTGILLGCLLLALMLRTPPMVRMIARDIEQDGTLLLRGALLLGVDRNAATVLSAATGRLQRPLLGIAVDRKQREVVQLLLESGADPNRADSEGWTPLSIARYRGDTEMAALLIRYGAVEHPLPVLPKKK